MPYVANSIMWRSPPGGRFCAETGGDWSRGWATTLGHPASPVPMACRTQGRAATRAAPTVACTCHSGEAVAQHLIDERHVRADHLPWRNLSTHVLRVDEAGGGVGGA